MARASVVAAQIAVELRRRVDAGDYPVDEWLPPATESSEEFGVHRTTVTNAWRQLDKWGTVEYHENIGAKVVRRRLPIITQRAKPAVEDDEEWRGLPGAVIAAGREPYCDITRSAEVPAPADAAAWLGVPTGTPVFVRERRQGVVENGGRDPHQVGTTHYTLATLAAVPEIRDVLDVDPPPVRRRMLDAGRTIHYDHDLGTTLGSAEECAALGLRPTTTVLELWRVCVDTGSGERLEATRIVADPGKVRFRY